jgi:hypothetical protein
MLRRIACVGDKLERGGEILAYSGPVFALGNAGHQVALIGKTAFCQACKSTGTIAKAGGPKRLNFMGETAADGDIVLCRCSTPPKIVAALSGESWCDDDIETKGACEPPPLGAMSAAVIAGLLSDTASSELRKFNDRYMLRDQRGEPISGAGYAMERANGKFEYGVTDQQGHTHLLSSAAAKENINVYLAG